MISLDELAIGWCTLAVVLFLILFVYSTSDRRKP